MNVCIMHVCRYVGMDGWMDEWMDGWMDGWMNEWMDAWVDEQTEYTP